MAQIAAQNVLMNCNIVIQEGSGILDNKHFLSLDKSEKLQDSFYSPKESKTRGFTDSMMNKERQDYASAEHAAAKAQREQEENMFYRQHFEHTRPFWKRKCTKQPENTNSKWCFGHKIKFIYWS